MKDWIVFTLFVPQALALYFCVNLWLDRICVNCGHRHGRHLIFEKGCDCKKCPGFSLERPEA